ncbi:MAG: hypothetical protein HYY06_22610 [Deltaproteobacteria bacterium]|nr:hypothetical protein [Deltaproteobacteria bacterium]
MAGLVGFLKYVDDRRAVVSQIEKRLLGLQAQYESFFQEVARARETELGQLARLISSQRASLPPEIDRALRAAGADVEREYDERLRELGEKAGTAERAADELRRESIGREQAVHAKNTSLDSREEELKARNAELLDRIRRYNGRIRQLGGGFGFLSNFFAMRGLHKERRAIDHEQADVAAQIEQLRAAWARVEEEHSRTEEALRKKWVERSAEAAALRTKLEYVESSRQRIVTRSTLERVLFQIGAQRPLGGPQDPTCPRCARPNPAGNHFCAYCAQRLGTDRPDFAGSWEEIAEINHHHAVFSEGMRACQEIIGLVRGLGTGLDNFARSVSEMCATQSRYPLPKLQIAVPEASVAWGQNFDLFDRTLTLPEVQHPLELARQARAFIDRTFTESSIKAFFETMGEELSRQAKAQWG